MARQRRLRTAERDKQSVSFNQSSLPHDPSRKYPIFHPAPPKAYRPSKSAIPITPEIELLALQSYLLADGLNALPPTIDPSKPLDPVMFLGFDLKDESGWRELKEEVAGVVVWDIGVA